MFKSLLSKILSLVATILVLMTAADGVASAHTGLQEPFARARWLTTPEDYPATGPLPLFRKEFYLARPARRAALFIVGLGDYNVRLNGKQVCPTGINQPWSQYEKTVYYKKIDVTKYVKPGTNCLGVQLCNSFWHNPPPPKERYFKWGTERTASEPFLLLAKLVIEDNDGTSYQFESDPSWKVSSGPITFSHVFAGEDFDARQRNMGWDAPGFDDQQWQAARVTSPPPAKLEAQFWPNFAEVRQYPPVSVQESAPDTWLFAFPQNCAAQLRVTLHGGKAGSLVKFRCGEHKNSQERLFGHYVVDTRLITDGSAFTHQWSSFYLGMQFVEVEGAVPEGKPNPKNLPVIKSCSLVQVRTDLPDTGKFECSSETLNDAYDLIDAAMQANASHVITDCPHREKLGWLEVPYLMGPSFLYRYDCKAWFAKILRDVRDAQLRSGKVLTVAPSYPAGKFPDKFDFTVEWGAVAVLLPWQLYEWTGDVDILCENYDMMRRFTDYVDSQASDGIAPGGLGDWYDYGHGHPPGESRFTPTQLTATATWAMCASAVADAAAVLGHDVDKRKYRDMHSQISRNFQRKFRDPADVRLFHSGSPQCANAMAICAHVVPTEDHEVLINEIVNDLKLRSWQQTPGDIGHVYFMRALAASGRSDVLHQVYKRRGLGSYGGIAAKGLTSLPETWDAMMDGYQSLNHCMLGHAMEWFFSYVAGIRMQPGTTGWRAVMVAPNPGDLTSANASFQAPTGIIGSKWWIAEGRFHLQATIPAGVSAQAVLPSGATKELGPGTTSLEERIAE